MQLSFLFQVQIHSVCLTFVLTIWMHSGLPGGGGGGLLSSLCTFWHSLCTWVCHHGFYKIGMQHWWCCYSVTYMQWCLGFGKHRLSVGSRFVFALSCSSLASTSGEAGCGISAVFFSLDEQPAHAWNSSALHHQVVGYISGRRVCLCLYIYVYKCFCQYIGVWMGSWL